MDSETILKLVCPPFDINRSEKTIWDLAVEERDRTENHPNQGKYLNLQGFTFKKCNLVALRQRRISFELCRKSKLR